VVISVEVKPYWAGTFPGGQVFAVSTTAMYSEEPAAYWDRFGRVSDVGGLWLPERGGSPKLAMRKEPKK